MQKAHKRKNKHNPVPEYKNINPFKAMEKHFKLYKHQETDFSVVFEPEQYHNVLGYQVASLPFPQGAFIVRNFVSQQRVEQIVAFALNQYCEQPYRTNLDSPSDLYAEKKQTEVKEEEKRQQPELKQKIQEEDEERGFIFNQKIRWANVGYQYDWTNRKYPDVKTQFPPSISLLCQQANHFYNTLKHSNRQYFPESAIINYYGQKDYMTGHLDDAEIDQTSPIYSFSFGLSCIFLIGGPTKETKPVSVQLNSGDLFIMGGESRQAYHGVPRILSQSFTPSKEVKLQIKKQWKNNQKNVQNYLKTHRININVRQVYPTEQPQMQTKLS